MKLTRTERWLLSNQFRILEKLYPDEKDYFARAREVIESGYETAYGWYCEHIYREEETLSEQEGSEVLDILQMHRILHYSYKKLTDKSGIKPSDVEFRGFDGNDRVEGKMMGFSQFLREEEDKFTELEFGDSFNSHSPELDGYRRMLAAWWSLDKKGDLTREQILQIVNARHLKRV